MTELENITLLQYFHLEDRHIYDYAQKFSKVLQKPVDVFEYGKFSELTFGEVKDIQYHFSNGITWANLIESVEKFKKIEISKSVQRLFLDWCNFMSFIKCELDHIMTLESHLITESDSRDVQAGVERLSKFGVLLQIDTLAKGDMLKYTEVRKLNYQQAFTKLLMDKEIQEFSYRKSKIKL